MTRTRRTYQEKMAAVKREHERKQERKASAQDRFGSEQRRLKSDYLARSKAHPDGKLDRC